MPKLTEFKKGTVCKQWTLMEKLDDGGNGDVWSASDRSGEVIAVKLLRRAREKEPYQRFASEIEALQEYGGITGVMPILNWELPEYKSKEVPWYAMPLAKPSLSFLQDKSPQEIVSLFSDLAETLVELHAKGASHRDIKIANILALRGRLYLSDFGLVKHSKSPDITPDRRDVGPKFTMAPEMRRSPKKALGMPADVFSFSKALWVALTKDEVAFDGQYSVTSEKSLRRTHPKLYTTTISQLLHDCTSHDAAVRPTMRDVHTKLTEWLEIVSDFSLQNAKQWEEFMHLFFPKGTPEEVVWRDPEIIASVINEVGQVPALNHMFLPSGGGNTIKGAKMAGEDGFIEIDEGLGVCIVKPKKLTYNSIAGSAEWNYLRLEAEQISPTGHYPIKDGDIYEYLTELEPGNYDHPDVAEYRYDREEEPALPETTRTVARFLHGSFVIFSTSSPYNQDPSTYDARHNRSDGASFYEYIKENAKSFRRKDA
ncbi:MAG: protein kinase [Sulfitobacter sp.]